MQASVNDHFVLELRAHRLFAVRAAFTLMVRSSFAHITGRPSNLRFEPYYDQPMGISKLRALVQFRLGSHILHIEQSWPARATFAGALFVIHKRWAMSSIVCLIAPSSVGSEPSFLACSKLLLGACVCSCGARTRNLSAIVWAGWLDGRSESLSLWAETCKVLAKRLRFGDHNSLNAWFVPAS